MTFGPDPSTPPVPRSRARLILIHVVFGGAFAAALALIFGFAVMQLWNHLMPQIVGARAVSYWQAVGLLVLTRLLVGSFSHGGSHHGHGRESRGTGHSWREYDAWWKGSGKSSFRGTSEGEEKGGQPGL
ncbi:hypothetical protein [Geothrix sp. 21YS21S-4]|uniref:hypothetical protein n=1 Tax=Geothrix sp. 21YS21S-4 TaxID=3068889 RepID=UPI0027B95FEE|nr:hypothetical protein [Geothrix sp. 21YS21S-4]